MNIKEYADNWRDTIRPAILRRDQYKCTICGIKHRARVYQLSKGHYREVDAFEEEFIKAQGRKVFTMFLQVAHLDHNKLNNDPSNLRTLCPYHHAKNDSEHKKFLRITYKRKINEELSERPGNVDEFNFYQFKNFVYELTGYKIPVQELKQIFEYVRNN
jgi:5-methylcytosine-specific restriction endonuclease McrA